jgi:hypothetical protein
VLRYYRDFTESLPDELTVFGGLIHAPDGSGAKLAAMVTGHCGPLAAGEAAVRPLKQFGPPAMDAIGPMPYSQLNGMLDAACRGRQPLIELWRSNDTATDDQCRPRPTPMGRCSLSTSMVPSASQVVTPPFRTAPIIQLPRSVRMDGPCHDRLVHRVGARNVCRHAALRGPGRYVNYLADDGHDPVAGVRDQLSGYSSLRSTTRQLTHEPEHPSCLRPDAASIALRSKSMQRHARPRFRPDEDAERGTPRPGVPHIGPMRIRRRPSPGASSPVHAEPARA